MQQIDEFGKNLSEIFIQYDDDDSGALGREEVIELLNDLCDQMGLTHMEEDQVTQLQGLMAGDTSDEVTLKVLTTTWHHVSRIMKLKFHSKSLATCRKVFAMFKKGNNERLGRDQIKAMCNYLAEQIPTRKPTFEEINDILEILDDNGDGEISFNEFLGNIDAVNKFIESLAIKSKTADGVLGKLGGSLARKSGNSVNVLHSVSALLDIKQKKKKTKVRFSIKKNRDLKRSDSNLSPMTKSVRFSPDRIQSSKESPVQSSG